MGRRVETERAWAMFHPSAGIQFDSCRRFKSLVIEFADTEAYPPNWRWNRYRKNGWRIIRVLISPAPVTQKEKAE